MDILKIVLLAAVLVGMSVRAEEPAKNVKIVPITRGVNPGGPAVLCGK